MNCWSQTKLLNCKRILWLQVEIGGLRIHNVVADLKTADIKVLAVSKSKKDGIDLCKTLSTATNVFDSGEM